MQAVSTNELHNVIGGGLITVVGGKFTVIPIIQINIAVLKNHAQQVNVN